MALLLKCGAIFLHVPKTGGSWVRDTLMDCDLLAEEQPAFHVHADMMRVMNKSLFGPDRQLQKFLTGRRLEKIFRPLGWFASDVEEPELDRFTFCFVRHPLGWYESVWRAGLRTDQVSKIQEKPEKFAQARRDPRTREWHPYNEFRPCYRENFNDMMREMTAQCPGYVSRLYASYATPRIDFVGKQESLADDLVRVLQQLNVDFDEGRLREKDRVNVSPSRPIAWDPEVKALVERLDYAAFYRFGYPTDTVEASPSAQ